MHRVYNIDVSRVSITLCWYEYTIRDLNKNYFLIYVNYKEKEYLRLQLNLKLYFMFDKENQDDLSKIKGQNKE